MQHKLLLGSTALVSAGLLMSSGVQAQEMRVGGMEVVLGGFTEFGIAGATKNTLTNDQDRKYTFWMDNELFVNANGATESGILYGSKLELEVGTGGLGGSSPETTIDEVGLFFSGNFGRVELGRDDGAEDVMYVGGEDAQAGTGGIDGDIANISAVQFADTGDAVKATYFTPRLAGFQVGASFTPDNDRGGADTFNGSSNDFENSIGGGVNWVGALGPADLTLSAVALWADCASNCTNSGTGVTSGFSDDEFSWAGGALLGFGGFTLGAGYNRNDTFVHDAQSNIVNVGLKYGFGAANVSVGWTYNTFDDSQLDDSNLFVVSGDVGLLPGVTLKGDVGYNTEDARGGNFGADNQTDTWSGVASIQLDY